MTSLSPEHSEILVRALQRDRFGEAMSWLTSPAGVRWVVAPLTSLAILIGAAVAHADDLKWYRPDGAPCSRGDGPCFAKDDIVFSNATPGQMIVPAADLKTGEGGWIAVDCTARIAMANSPVFTIEPGSALDKLCDTIGSEE